MGLTVDRSCGNVYKFPGSREHAPPPRKPNRRITLRGRRWATPSIAHRTAIGCAGDEAADLA